MMVTKQLMVVMTSTVYCLNTTEVNGYQHFSILFFFVHAQKCKPFLRFTLLMVQFHQTELNNPYVF